MKSEENGSYFFSSNSLKVPVLLVCKKSVLFSSNSLKLESAILFDMSIEKVSIVWQKLCESVIIA